MNIRFYNARILSMSEDMNISYGKFAYAGFKDAHTIQLAYQLCFRIPCRIHYIREMFSVTGLAKLRDKDAAAVPAEQVLQMTVQGGAWAMNLKECDCLAEGKLYIGEEPEVIYKKANEIIASMS